MGMIGIFEDVRMKKSVGAWKDPRASEPLLGA